MRTILNVDQTAVVAHEVMQAGQYLHLGVEGFREDGTLVIPTTWARCEEVIHYGANVDADPSADPTLPMWNQLQAQIEQINRDGITQEKLDEINGCVEAAAHSATRAERAMDNSIASSNFATRSMNSAAEFANQAEESEKTRKPMHPARQILPTAPCRRNGLPRLQRKGPSLRRIPCKHLMSCPLAARSWAA